MSKDRPEVPQGPGYNEQSPIEPPSEQPKTTVRSADKPDPPHLSGIIGKNW